MASLKTTMKLVDYSSSSSSAASSSSSSSSSSSENSDDESVTPIPITRTLSTSKPSDLLRQGFGFEETLSSTNQTAQSTSDRTKKTLFSLRDTAICDSNSIDHAVPSIQTASASFSTSGCTASSRRSSSFPAMHELYEEKIGLKVNLVDVFLNSMGAWYTNLSKKEKDTLTPLKIKRRCLHEAYQVNLPYRKIPVNWLEILRRDYDLKLYRKTNERKESLKKSKLMRMSVNNVQKTHTSVNNIGAGNSVGNIDIDPKFTQSGRIIKPPITLQVGQSGAFYSANVVVDKANNRNSEEKTSTFNRNQVNNSRPKRFKKLIDLTEELPPSWWLEAYAKNGFPPPRELTVCTLDDRTIIFYDYTVSEVNHDKLRIYPVPNFFPA